MAEKSIKAAQVQTLINNIKQRFFSKAEAQAISFMGETQEVGSMDVDSTPTAGSTNLVTCGGVSTALGNYVTLATSQTISALKTLTNGLVVSGRVYGSGDDEGIVISKASNGFAGLCLGSPSGVRSVFCLSTGNPYWRYNNGTTTLDISHPAKSGTIALTSDIPPSLKNPYSLTFGSKTYDGSSEKEIVKSDLGLGNVENKSSATIRGELTAANVTTALGSTYVQNANYATNAGQVSRKLTEKALSSIVAVEGSDNAWNSRQNSWVFENYNNALAITVGGISNDRNVNIQSGHSSLNYAYATGNLYLNRLGGNVYIGNGKTVYHSGNLTASVIGGLGTLPNSITGNASTATNAEQLNGRSDYYHTGNANNSSTPWSCSSLSSATKVTAACYEQNRVTRNINSSGWYKFFSANINNANGGGCLMTIGKRYGNSFTECYQISVSISYNGVINFNQLSGARGSTQTIQKIRVTYTNEGPLTIDMYINTTVNDTYFVTGIGQGSFVQPTLVTDTPANSVEFALTNGTSCSGNATIGGVSTFNSGLAVIEGVPIRLRTLNASYYTNLRYDTAGNEALILAMKNNVTSFIVKSGDSGVTADSTSAWQNITPSIQVKGQSLYVNSLIASGVTPSYNFYVGGTAYVSSNFIAGGEVTAGSDARWKEHITPLSSNPIMSLNPVEWDWKEGHGSGHCAGFIAQDVMDVIPFAVKGSEEVGYGLNYDALQAYEVAAIQDHEERLRNIEKHFNIN